MTDSSFMEGFMTGQNSGGSNNNGGYGGMGAWGAESWWFIIVLFALWGGFGGNGWGGNGGGAGTQGAITRTDLSSEFAFNDLQNAVRGISDSVNTGFQTLDTRVCQQSYETAQLVNGVQSAVSNGFSTLNSSLCQQQYDTAQQLNAMNIANMQNANAANVVALQNANAIQSQLASCCCDMKSGQQQIINAIDSNACATGRAIENGFATTNYNLATQISAVQNQMANNTRDIIDSQQAGTRAILDYLCTEKISDLQNENQSLKLAASQAAQNTLLTNAMSAQTAQLINRIAPYPQPSYLVSPPFALNYGFGTYGNYGFNNCGCGCNSGCGCGN